MLRLGRQQMEDAKATKSKDAAGWSGYAARWPGFSCSQGCNAELRKSDAELGLNAQQSAGRRIYDRHCDQCHEPYSTSGKKGPGLKGIFKKQYLSESGLPANDERVGEIIKFGRSKMPGFGQTLDQQQIQDLLAYMHTL